MNDNWLKRSMVIRMIAIAALTVALLVPSFMVMEIIKEREHSRDSATLEVGEKWGQQQVIAGPILTLPYRRIVREEKGTTREIVEHAQILPESLAISVDAKPEVRYRGIYQIVLYNAEMHVNGKLSMDALHALNIKNEDVLWNEAVLSFGISDLKGIKKTINVKWDGRDFTAEPGVAGTSSLISGVSIQPALSAEHSAHTFSVDINLNGSGELQFVPFGKETVARIASPWATPSFIGRFLPDTRDVQPSGFHAEWKVLHLNRNFPQQWIAERLPGKGDMANIETSAFGVRLLLPVDEYQQTMRSAKYAIIFIALTFLSVFLTEVLNKKIVHPVQYALVGFALVLFYSLLLSLSEQMPFSAAYALSSMAIVLLVGGYTRSILGSMRFAGIIAGVLFLLYAFLFVILQQEDFATASPSWRGALA